MNYRHAFHAGNFADCVKHALFIVILSAMQRKAKPLLVLDTHAGIGRYDLSGQEAQKTGEWRDGVAKVLAAHPAVLASYITMIESLGLYPGSPLIAAAMLRDTDRLICCELHKEDAPLLRRAMMGRANVAVHERDGYAALRAFLPPPEKRAFVLIDPPFERVNEFLTLQESLLAAYEKFKTGVYVVWYPIKHRAPVRDFFAGLKLSKLRDVVNVEFLLREPLDPTRLNGCGLLVVNPPFGFEADALPIVQALVEVLDGSGCAVERLIDE
ncbi:MAG: 23S rRNA (adenine(2030)-N(6))-methyltransferase RlmJ [Acidocella sp. 20-61-6]|nr:MAG: 23S rRNA (adenine(2030)-N(6))-methyltransferase RlmJ [Acidocella sp. 20-61-6]